MAPNRKLKILQNQIFLLYCCRGISTTAFGSTGQTYSQAPQPVQSASSMLIPVPGISLIASYSQRSTQEKQPQPFARQCWFSALAIIFSFGIGSLSGSKPVGDEPGESCIFSAVPLTFSKVSPREKKPCLKKSLRVSITSSCLSGLSF